MTLIEKLKGILKFIDNGDVRSSRFMIDALIKETQAEIDALADMIELIEEGDEWKNG